MNTVDSWIDPEWIAELVDRLDRPPGSGGMAPESAAAAPTGLGKNVRTRKEVGAVERESERGKEGATGDLPDARLEKSPLIEGRKLRSAVEIVAKFGPLPEANIGPLPEANIGPLPEANIAPVPEAKPEERGVALSPEGVESLAKLGFSRFSRSAAVAPKREPQAMMELSQREKVRARLAELRAKTDSIGVVLEPWPFTSAE